MICSVSVYDMKFPGHRSIIHHHSHNLFDMICTHEWEFSNLPQKSLWLPLPRFVPSCASCLHIPWWFPWSLDVGLHSSPPMLSCKELSAPCCLSVLCKSVSPKHTPPTIASPSSYHLTHHLSDRTWNSKAVQSLSTSYCMGRQRTFFGWCKAWPACDLINFVWCFAFGLSKACFSTNCKT